jgi:DNA-binding CsgD family transcriptional regulator
MTRRTGGVPADGLKLDSARSGGPATPEIAGQVVDSPAAWEAHVTRCLDDLSPPARHLVEVGAVFGPSFAVADVAEVVGQPAGGLLAAVQEAVELGALVPAPEALGFRHEVIRRVAYEAVPAAVRLALHRQIGELLLRRREWEAGARHLMFGATAGDRVTAAGLEHAALEVRKSSPEWASELALRALAITEPDDADRFDRAATVVEALVAAGRLGDADYLAHRALGSRGVPAPAAARCRLALAELQLVTGHPHAAVHEAQSVALDPAAPAPFHALADVWLLRAMLALDDPRAAGRQAELILSGGPGRDEFLPLALAAEGILTWRDGRVADALALVRAAVAQFDRRPPPSAAAPPQRLLLAWMLTTLGDLDEAAELVDAANDEVTTGAHRLWSAAPAVVAARISLAAGRPDEASASAHAAIDLATELGPSWILSSARTVLAEVALMGSELSEAVAHLERRGSDIVWPPWAVSRRRLAEARVAEAEGGPERVLEQHGDLYDDVALDARLLLNDPAGAAWLVQTALRAGDRARAERVVAQAEHLAIVNASFPAVVAGSRHASGLLHADPGLVAEAANLHRHAVAKATAWEDAGVLLLDARNSAGRELLERAVDGFEQLGAERDAARVRSRLRAIGVRWRHGRRADRPVSGWESLTDTERAVAEIVAEGLTNAEVAERMYLSRHTVDFNLRQIFRKLGIRSRVALARLYFERQSGTDAKDHASV